MPFQKNGIPAGAADGSPHAKALTGQGVGRTACQGLGDARGAGLALKRWASLFCFATPIPYDWVRIKSTVVLQPLHINPRRRRSKLKNPNGYKQKEKRKARRQQAPPRRRERSKQKSKIRAPDSAGPFDAHGASIHLLICSRLKSEALHFTSPPRAGELGYPRVPALAEMN